MNTRNVLLALTLPVVFAACSKQEQVSEVDWAKAALARNPAMEIISTDEAAGIFTVRDTTNGSLYKLRTNELIAGPLPPKAAAKPAAPPAAQPPAPAAEPSAAPAETAGSQTTGTAAAQRAAGEPLVEGP